MKTVYLVRHGESRANVRGSKYFEGGESPLTKKGVEQAAYIAQRASKLPIDVLVASTMLRAQQTAKAIVDRIGKPLLTSELFTERRDPSSLIGRLWEDAEVQNTFREWEKTLFSEKDRVLDGENFADVKARAGEALRFLEKMDESNILVITHGFFLRMLLARVLIGEKITTDEFERLIATTRTQNTGITVLE